MQLALAADAAGFSTAILCSSSAEANMDSCGVQLKWAVGGKHCWW